MSEQAPQNQPNIPEQIQHPDSIPHNFDQTEPIAVVSRGFNTSSEHPHPVNYFQNDEEADIYGPRKQRGIVVTETTLGGKPFYVAERPGSKTSNEAENNNSSDDKSKPEDTKPEKPGTDIVPYKPLDPKKKAERPQQPKDSVDPSEQPTTEQPNSQEAAKRQEELSKLTEAYQKARDNYARISAGRGRRSFTLRGRFSKKDLAKAQEEFDIAQIALTTKELEIAIKDEKISRQDLDKVAAASAAENQWGLATALLDARTRTPQGKIGQTTRKFHEWWNNQGRVKKTLTTLGAGIAIGVPVGILAGPVTAVLAGGALGGRIAKSVANNRMSLSARNYNGEATTRAGAMDDFYQARLMYAPTEHVRIYPDADEHTEQHVNMNRKDLAWSVGSAALGAAGGVLLGDIVFGKGATHVVANGAHKTGAHKAIHHAKPAHHGPTKHHDHGPEVNVNNVNHEYVSQVYEHTEGLHPGFTDMTHAANMAQKHNLIQIVHPNPSNPNLFYYKATKAGAKLANVHAGSNSTADIVKILSHFSKLKIS